MPKRPDNYYRPDNLSEAWRLLQQPETVPLGGGSKLLAGDITSAVVDLQGLGLGQIRQTDGSLRVGAMTRLGELADYVAEYETELAFAPLLQKAIQQAGPNTYRHAATLGGSVAARPADSELLAALLVLETSVTLFTGEAASMSLAEYVAGEERPFALITHLDIPTVPGKGSSARVARTPADYPIVSVTGWQAANGLVRLAATGIDKRPLRLHAAEAALAGGLTPTTIEAAAEAAHASSNHPGDFRGDAAYRADMAAVLTRRVLNHLR
ncbi:MAG: FAD binding domain-containing protein [Anaerolineales bacterium]|nr:FAD binding domain-containing protein [Anaerolineales bacterium]